MWDVESEQKMVEKEKEWDTIFRSPAKKVHAKAQVVKKTKESNSPEHDLLCFDSPLKGTPNKKVVLSPSPEDIDDFFSGRQIFLIILVLASLVPISD